MAELFRGGKAGHDANKRMYLQKYLIVARKSKINAYLIVWMNDEARKRARQ